MEASDLRTRHPHLDELVQSAFQELVKSMQRKLDGDEGNGPVSSHLVLERFSKAICRHTLASCMQRFEEVLRVESDFEALCRDAMLLAFLHKQVFDAYSSISIGGDDRHQQEPTGISSLNTAPPAAIPIIIPAPSEQPPSVVVAPPVVKQIQLDSSHSPPLIMDTVEVDAM